nr:hypothetical protein GCM10020063_079090 [Dactylosporangium thailandense]
MWLTGGLTMPRAEAEDGLGDQQVGGGQERAAQREGEAVFPDGDEPSGETGGDGLAQGRRDDRRSGPIGARGRMLAAGRPLLAAAQDARQIDAGLELNQILDLVVAIAKIPGTPEYRQPILDAALAGLHRRDT